MKVLVHITELFPWYELVLERGYLDGDETVELTDQDLRLWQAAVGVIEIMALKIRRQIRDNERRAG